MRHRFAPIACVLLASAAGAQGLVPGRILVGCRDVHSIVELDAAGAAVDEFALEDGAGSDVFDVGPDGRLYVANGTANVVAVHVAGGQKVGEIGAGSTLSGPGGLAFGPSGNLYVSSNLTGRVLEFRTNGAFVREIGAGAGLSFPRGITFGPNGHLYVLSFGGDRVVEFDANGAKVRELGVGSSMHGPYAAAFGPDGHLYVTSLATNRVVVLSLEGPNGAELPAIGAGTGLTSPSGLAWGPDGHLYVASFSSDELYEFDGAGALVHAHPIVTALGPAPSLPIGVSIVPWRFKARITGTIARGGEKPSPIKDKGSVVSFVPGSRRVLLSFQDDPANAQDMASAISVAGTSGMSLSGIESLESAAATKRWWLGTEIHRDVSPDDGVAALALRVAGKKGPDGTFVPTSATGALHRAAGGVVVDAKISTAGLVK
ncbi:MAG TPA: NHL repeat-containing protein [Planctomycetota bacterium]|nr:NHL repeat-containing protein [Planctomycetota bacterium]